MPLWIWKPRFLGCGSLYPYLTPWSTEKGFCFSAGEPGMIVLQGVNVMDYISMHTVAIRGDQEHSPRKPAVCSSVISVWLWKVPFTNMFSEINSDSFRYALSKARESWNSPHLNRNQQCARGRSVWLCQVWSIPALRTAPLTVNVVYLYWRHKIPMRLDHMERASLLKIICLNQEPWVFARLSSDKEF